MSPKFIEIHGLGVPAGPQALPQTFDAPYACRSARLYEFLLPAHTSALQRACDVLFNAPSGGAVHYQPLMPLAFISLIESVKLNDMDPVQSRIGWFEESDTVFWFLALATDAAGARTICGVPLYCFVDQPQAMLTGREVQGWPKEMSTLKLDLNAAGEFDRFAVTTMGMPAFGPEVQAAPVEVLTISRVPGSAGLTATNVIGSLDDVWRLVWEMGGAAFELLRPGVAAGLLAEIRSGAFPLSLLKQFRDAADGTTACYQAIVSVPIHATAIRPGGMLPGTYLVNLPEIASHPIVSDLGIDRAALSSIKGFWLDLDFVIGQGTEIWRAS